MLVTSHWDSRGLFQSTTQAWRVSGLRCYALAPPQARVEAVGDAVALTATARAQGAESAYSGLIAMLIAADLLKNADPSKFGRHVVFAALAGEALDLMVRQRELA